MTNNSNNKNNNSSDNTFINQDQCPENILKLAIIYTTKNAELQEKIAFLEKQISEKNKQIEEYAKNCDSKK